MKVQFKNCFLQLLVVALFTSAVCFGTVVNAHAAAIELRFAHHIPPIAHVAKAIEQWAKQIEKETGGKIKITIFPSAGLLKGSEAFSGTVAGVCDIALINLVYERSKLGLNNMMTLLALPFPNDERGVVMWDKMLKKFPMMEKEFKPVKLLAKSVDMYASIHLKKAAKVPKDLEGLKIAVMGGDKVALLKEIDASPIGIPANDWYLSLEKGVLDGVYAPIAILVDRGIEPTVPFHIDLPMGQGANVVVMNKDKFNSLPDDVKTVIDKSSKSFGELINKANMQNVEDSWAKCRKLGQTIYKPTAQELKIWMEEAKGTANMWITQNQDKGPTRQMITYARKIIEGKE